MKKIIIAFLATLACVLTIAAFGCKPNGNNKPKEYTVVFTPTDNLEYVCDELEEGEYTFTVKSGTVVTFSVEVPTLYAVPNVYANDDRISPKDGVYSVTVTSNVTITTAEVELDRAMLSGTGTNDSPLLISSPADYFYVAERINEGNNAFIGAYYALENDIDFGGVEIPVIGDGTYSYFMGNFNGDGHTLSNFKINANGLTYAGLFGYVISSGSDDGSGMIVNLNIDNFVIEAQAASGNAMFVGSFIGYGIASTVIACSATNGAIYVHADAAVFSYVGGAVGIQNSATLTNGNDIQYFPAATSYVHTNVDIDCDGGVLATGGVVGYVVSEHERAISSIVNSYSEGNVFGGIYSGGVAGYLGDYSSMANCYSLSEIYAYARYLDNEIYSHAYAGGLVGYIGNDAIITDSFAKSALIDGDSASGASFVHTGELVGGIAEASVIADEGILHNCHSGKDVVPTLTFFKEALFWQDCDWVMANNAYPVINMEESQANNFTVKFNYSKKVDGKDFRELKISLSEDFYSPMFYFYGDEFGDIVIADNGETSYGYFFDASLTQKVPYGFIPTRNITLYTGFKDYGEVSGTYYLIARNSNRAITLVLNNNGTYTYNDGVEFSDFYSYNGTRLIFSNAIFARLSESVTVDGEGSSAVARPDYNYNFAKFGASKAEGGLEIFDGRFFTQEDPLKANRYAISGEYHYNSDQYVFYTNNTGKFNGQSFTYELTSDWALTITIGETTKSGSVSGSVITVEGNNLSKYDVFKGVWEISANINRRYEFDGAGNWEYKVKGAKKAGGTYTIGADGVATLESGLTAQIDASGLLHIKKGDNNEYFVKVNSYSGAWVDLENNIILIIDGFGSSLTGGALLNMGGATTQLTYIIDGFFDGDGKTHVTLLNGYALFGYLTCNDDGSFAATFFSSSTTEYLSGYTFYLMDALEGDWVGEGKLGDVDIDSIHFNGLGHYGNGSVSINDGDEIEYTLDPNFDGTFGEYKVSFDDEQNKITLTLGSETVELSRKDEISAYVLISDKGIKYSFNGGGKLSKGGKLTITDASGKEIAKLGYKIISGSIEDLDIKLELYSEFRGTVKVGEITVEDFKFAFKYTGNVTGLSDAILTIDNPFTGSWCASDFGYNITIGTLDLSNSVEGKFLDMKEITSFTYMPEYKCLMVAYITGEMTTATPLYLIMLSEGNMVISSYNVLIADDDLIYCALNDGLYGDWENWEDTQKSIRFDGMADSLYTVGIARNESGEVFFYTRRFGTFYYWSADGENAYIIEKDGSAIGANVYFKTGRNRIVFKDFDLSSTILEAKEGETVYKFYLTHVEVDGVEKEYVLSSVKGDVTELVIYENEEDTVGVRFKVNHTGKTVETLH